VKDLKDQDHGHLHDHDSHSVDPAACKLTTNIRKSMIMAEDPHNKIAPEIEEQMIQDNLKAYLSKAD